MSAQPPLVGRDAERERLRRLLALRATDHPTVALVVGEPGIGKTSLLRAALSGVAGPVLHVDCDQHETRVPYAVIDQLLRLPELRRQGRHVPLRGDAEPFEVAAVLLQALDDSAAWDGDPLTLTVDDVQWADPQSLPALTFALRRLRGQPVRVLLACRTEGVATLPPGLVRLAEGAGGRIDLSGLTADAIASLAAQSYGAPVTRRAAARVHDHTGGNPLHALTLFRDLSRTSVERAAPLPAPRSYSPLVLAALAESSLPAQSLAESLAVLGSRAPLAECAAVAGVTEDPRLVAAELVERGLVELRPTATGLLLAFAHDLVRASIVGDLSERRRLELHAAAAATLSGADALRHRIAAAGSPDPILVSASAREAARAEEAGALADAATWLLLSAPLAATRSEREQIVTRAASHLLAAGRPLGSLTDELESFTETPLRNYVLARLALVTGSPTRALELLRSIWVEIESDEGPHELVAPVADTFAILAENEVRFDEVAAWARRALDAGGDSLGPAVMLSIGLAMTQGPREAEHQLGAVSPERGGRRRTLDVTLGTGIARVYGNRLAAGEQDLREVLQAPEIRGSMLPLTNARCYLAEALFRAGRWSEALDLAEATASLVDDADQIWLAALPHGIAASVLAAQGKVARAVEHAEIASTTAELADLLPARVWADHAWLRIEAARGDSAQVIAVGDRIRGTTWGGFPEWVHHWRATYVEALVAADRVDDAVILVQELESEAAAGGDVSVACEAARARGVLEAARGESDAAEAAFAAGLALDPGQSRPFGRARLELAAGAHQRRTGRRRLAADTLTSAAGRLSQLGASPWLERCERELAACGLTPAKRSEPAGRDLTSQERMVAHLVARGRTNREVAEELVLSVKTIEFHLGRIYRKLGVRSRTELAARLAPRGALGERD